MNINAQTLREQRDKRNMSQKEFAKFLGISYRSLQGYEAGNNIPEAKKLLISNKLNTKITHKNEEDSGIRFEDAVAKKVLNDLEPFFDKVIEAIAGVDIELTRIREIQSEMKRIQEETKDSVDIIEKRG